MAGYESLDLVGKVLPCVGRALDSLLISAWRGQRDLGALDKPAGHAPADLLEREIAQLRRENQRR